MSSPNRIYMTDSEDEHLDSPMSPNPEDETLLHTTEEEEDPSEEEPFEDETENTHSASPTNQPERTPSFRPYRNHPNGPLRMYTARKSVRLPQINDIIRFHDPYQQPSSSTASRRCDTRRWTWVPHTLDQWRRQEGNPYPQVGEPSTVAPTDPVTGEPPHHTIALLIARTARHETQLEHLEENIEALPPPEFYEEVERDTEYLRRSQQDHRRVTEELSARVERNSRRLSEIERRMDGFEQSLERLHTVADISRGYASYILGGHHVPK